MPFFFFFFIYFSLIYLYLGVTSGTSVLPFRFWPFACLACITESKKFLICFYSSFFFIFSALPFASTFFFFYFAFLAVAVYEIQFCGKLNTQTKRALLHACTHTHTHTSRTHTYTLTRSVRRTACNENLSEAALACV